MFQIKLLLNIDVKLLSSMETIHKLETFFPIHAQILDCEAIELHKAFTHVQMMGGQPVAIKTDCVLYRANKRIPMDDEWAPNVLKFKNEDKSHPPIGTFRFKNESKLECQPHMYTHVQDVYEPAPTNFNRSDFEHTLLDRIVNSEKGLLVLGSAGTGKSTLINRLNDKLNEMKKTVVRLAPTNKAALVIQGKTLDKYAHQVLNRSGGVSALTHVDYIFVDEISMVREVFYHMLLSIKFAQPHIKFIICGDFFQLPPVEDRVKDIYKASRALWELTDGNILHLTECMRANREFFDITEALRQNKPIDISVFKTQHIQGTDLHVCCTNNTRKRVNAECMKLASVGFPTMEIAELAYAKESQPMTIFQGMPIIARLGNKTLDICNNETFVIQGLDLVNEKVYITNERFELETPNHILMPVKQFRTHFLPAFCITIHKAQGATFNQPFTIHEWTHKMMTHTMKYVAMSRATGTEIVRII